MIGGMDKTVLLWRSHNNDQVVHAPIIHVAVADTDETYGAQTVAEKYTFTNTNNSANNARNANDNAKNANYNAYWPVLPVRFVDPGSAGSVPPVPGYSDPYGNRSFHVLTSDIQFH